MIACPACASKLLLHKSLKYMVQIEGIFNYFQLLFNNFKTPLISPGSKKFKPNYIYTCVQVYF